MNKCRNIIIDFFLTCVFVCPLSHSFGSLIVRMDCPCLEENQKEYVINILLNLKYPLSRERKKKAEKEDLKDYND